MAVTDTNPAPRALLDALPPGLRRDILEANLPAGTPDELFRTVELLECQRLLCGGEDPPA